MTTFSNQRLLALLMVMYGLWAFVVDVAYPGAADGLRRGLDVPSVVFSLLVMAFGAVLFVEGRPDSAERSRLRWLLAVIATAMLIAALFKLRRMVGMIDRVL